MKRVVLIVVASLSFLVLILIGGFVVKTSVRFARERESADRLWAAQTPAKLPPFGAVKRLSVLPLVEADAVRDDLRRGVGLSYLIEADGARILFDVAGNAFGEPKPPVVTNAAKLGIDLAGVQAIFISHTHRDHVGDLGDLLRVRPVGEALARIPVYVPEPLEAPSGHEVVLAEPRVLAPGVATIGAISKTYWGMGTIREQALAVNVEGKGIVLVVGCGHQSLPRLLSRAHALFDAPLYGIVGGLHYPATRFGEAPAPVSWLMRLAATGLQPWHGPIGKDDVNQAMATLDRERPGVVGLSPHDSCGWTRGAFRSHFADRYRDVKAGAAIVVEAPVATASR